MNEELFFIGVYRRPSAIKILSKLPQKPLHQFPARIELQIALGGDDFIVARLSLGRNPRAGDAERNHAVSVGSRSQRRPVVG